ncbi:RNA-binding protein Musashi homolog 1 isoform X1 [Lates japonicus]|uniref:RNA-binding protein Musashi homolog 1 isoform X1 n=1 Tax=Lates japonicus TaxID=270547 RepID=A0AAD3MFP4_LATJO|nr:RNA-binding protein Musashi homolog 1 isoform X1 [Lates japonicus]
MALYCIWKVSACTKETPKLQTSPSKLCTKLWVSGSSGSRAVADTSFDGGAACHGGGMRERQQRGLTGGGGGVCPSLHLARSPLCHPGPNPPSSSHSLSACFPARLGPDTHGTHSHTQRGHGMETEGSQSSLSTTDSPHDPCKMFIGGLSWQTTQEGLKEYFCKYGEVKECMVMRDPVTKRSRGFGFVTFVDQAGVDKVLAQTRHELDSKTECWTSGGLVTGGDYQSSLATIETKQ